MGRISVSTLSTQEMWATAELITTLLGDLYDKAKFPVAIGQSGLLAAEIKDRGSEKTIVFHLFRDAEDMRTMFANLLNAGDRSDYRSALKKIAEEGMFPLTILRDKGSEFRDQVGMIAEYFGHLIIIGSHNQYSIEEEGFERNNDLEFGTYLISPPQR